jgi:phytanoyl-CoA hydroxylase
MKKILNKYKNLKKAFYNNGWVKIESFFTEKQINKINKELDIFVKNIAPKLKPGEIHYAKNKINTIHVLDKYSKFFKKLLHSKKVKILASSIIDDDVVPQWSQFFAKPAKEGMTAPPHQDNYYWCVDKAKTLTMWIALENVNKKNGSLFYYDQSNKMGRLNHEASYAKGTSQTVEKKILNKIPKCKKKITSAKAGDIFIHHGYTIHGSEKNKSNKSRRGMSMWFKGKKSKISKRLLKSYKESLEKQTQSIYQT